MRLPGVLLMALLLCGCASRQAAIYPLNVEDITRGRARILVYAPEVVKVSYPWETEVMLVGRASAYPKRLYLLIFAMEGQKEKFSVAPAVRRYYRFNMSPFSAPFHDRDGVVVMTVSLHEFKGFNFLGEPIEAQPWLWDIHPIRFTYSLEANNGS